MESVLISIHPIWCELIANGKKIVEVRKTRPRIDTPFKCYIYCTKDKHGWFDFFRKQRLDGKVIGEFVCDKIVSLDDDALLFGLDEISDSQIEGYSCLSLDKLFSYKGNKEFIYGWHISDLVIYDKPKELSEFRYFNPTVKFENGYPIPTHKITRPPQSWCYVEKVKEGAE